WGNGCPLPGLVKESFNTSKDKFTIESFSMEKHIKVSTQGRLTIPKQIRDSLRISDGQPVVMRTNSAKREIILILQPTMSDYK
ncbi:MAG: AbrB/MazE/SpoVT family DNA-binding domain-containing protein, partial [Nitrososphaerales archaeon]